MNIIENKRTMSKITRRINEYELNVFATSLMLVILHMFLIKNELLLFNAQETITDTDC